MNRVLMYIPGATYGGAHNQAARLAPMLKSYGFSIVVLIPDEPGDAARRLLAQDIETHWAPLSRLRATPSLSTHWTLIRQWSQQVNCLSRLIRDLDIDLVQIHGVTCIDGALAAGKEGKPLVWQLIDTRAPLALRALLVPYVKRSNAVIMTTGTKIQREFPGLRRKTEIFSFFPPVDGSHLVGDAAQRREVREHLAVADDLLLVNCLANLNPQKGLEILLKATAIAWKRNAQFSLRIRGSESLAHPGYLDSLKELASILGLGPGVIDVLDPACSPSSFLCAADIFVLASKGRSEGVPTVLLEAMTAGMAIVATDVGGVSEAVPKSCGLLVPPGNENALADALIEVMQWSDSRRQRAASEARSYANAHFDLHGCTEVHASAYRAAMAKRRN